jgi:hypothetical protein
MPAASAIVARIFLRSAPLATSPCLPEKAPVRLRNPQAWRTSGGQ